MDIIIITPTNSAIPNIITNFSRRSQFSENPGGLGQSP